MSEAAPTEQTEEAEINFRTSGSPGTGTDVGAGNVHADSMGVANGVDHGAPPFGKAVGRRATGAAPFAQAPGRRGIGAAPATPPFGKAVGRRGVGTAPTLPYDVGRRGIGAATPFAQTPPFGKAVDRRGRGVGTAPTLPYDVGRRGVGATSFAPAKPRRGIVPWERYWEVSPAFEYSPTRPLLATARKQRCNIISSSERGGRTRDVVQES